ncbi:TPA: hypothetical protein O8L42_003752 [Klebsiella quasipneumoniae]|uniref:hypothetical protein n=1 Tax=Klebsiella quasipneumoniae TaxID=1463165 RepID=UPI00237D5BCB|nr:hypothetical protein [Klebsiella quasipneumoniae]MDL2152601.1 hypothetical protein [Klebsiella quasipneumoniae]MDW2824645.1 hypothetical protein [Klebsiella quasipneumoniae]HDC4342793.1 hypothetical protein [Klebsiella quasipneumoniae]
MYLTGKIDELRTDGVYLREVNFSIVEIRPSADGKPGSEDADPDKMKVTFMSSDGDIRVVEMDNANDTQLIYEQAAQSGSFDGFTIFE